MSEGGYRTNPRTVWFIANQGEDERKPPVQYQWMPPPLPEVSAAASTGPVRPVVSTNLSPEQYQSRTNPALSSPSTSSSTAGTSTPPPTTPGTVPSSSDNLHQREPHIVQQDQGLQPTGRSNRHSLPRVPVVQRSLPSPTASTPDSFTSPSSTTSMHSMPPKRILVTTDCSTYAMVDVTDLSSADYIVNTISDKLSLAPAQRRAFRIWQTTNLERGSGEPLSLAELYDLCFARADEHGNLKFFVDHQRFPLQEHDVPDVVSPAVISPETVRAGRRARSPSESEASQADRSGSDDLEPSTAYSTRSPPTSRVPFTPTLPPHSPRRHNHPFAIPAKARSDSPTSRPRSPQVMSPERLPGRHHPLPIPPGPSSPNYRSPSMQEDVMTPPAGRMVHIRAGSDAAYEREAMRRGESSRPEGRRTDAQKIADASRGESHRGEAQTQRPEAAYRPEPHMDIKRHPVPRMYVPDSRSREPSSIREQLVRQDSWVMVPLPNPTEIRSPPTQDTPSRTSPSTRAPVRGRNIPANMRHVGKNGLAVPPPPRNPPPAPPVEDVRQPSRPLQPPTQHHTWSRMTQDINKAKSTGNLRGLFSASGSSPVSPHPATLRPGQRNLPINKSSREGMNVPTFLQSRDQPGSIIPTRYGAGTNYQGPRKLPVQGSKPEINRAQYGGYPGGLMSPIDTLARPSSAQGEASPVSRRAQSPNPGLTRSPHTRSPGGRPLAFGTRVPEYGRGVGIDIERANAYGGIDTSRSPTSPLTRTTPRVPEFSHSSSSSSSIPTSLGTAFMPGESTLRPEDRGMFDGMFQGGTDDLSSTIITPSFSVADVPTPKHSTRASSPTESFQSGNSDQDSDSGSIWNVRPAPPALHVDTGDTPVASRDAPPPPNQISSATRRERRSTFHDPTWAPRPSAEDVYENLEEFFPHHDLDKPVIEASSGGTSPTGPDYTIQLPPSAFGNIGARVRGKKSIRIVAQEHKKRIDRTSKAGESMMTAMQRKRSTKLWGSKLEELPTKGLVPLFPPDSPSGGPKPIFKWVRGELIGQGSYGKVYLALNATTGEMIAVKQVELPRTASDKIDTRQLAVVEALKSESETLKDLDHPNIVQYLGFEETPTFLSIFLEYVPGGSVGSCLQKHGKFDEEVTKSFTAQILDGLEYLHSRNILHRDLKADNILVETSGICKISDFGISKRAEDNAPVMTAMQGTVFWMAPEVINSNKKGYNSKIDIWSVGCVVLEMWAGKRPWSEDEAVAVMFKLYQAKLPPPVPDDVSLSPLGLDFRNKCFAINPDDRPNASVLRQHDYLNLQPNWSFTGFK